MNPIDERHGGRSDFKGLPIATREEWRGIIAALLCVVVVLTLIYFTF